MPDKLFTLDEALRLLPVVRRLLVEIQDAKAAVTRAGARLEELLALTGGNGHLAGQVAEARRELQIEASQLQAKIGELDELGVELKGIDEGLVDFQSLREGRVVYLCYRLDEDTIAYWHELDTGFAGRQPL